MTESCGNQNGGNTCREPAGHVGPHREDGQGVDQFGDEYTWAYEWTWNYGR